MGGFSGSTAMEAGLRDIDLMFGHGNSEAITTTVRYLAAGSGVGGAGANSGFDTTEVNVQMPCPFTGVLIELASSLAVTPGAGITITGTLRKGGSDTALAVSHVDSDGVRAVKTDTDSIAVTKGDLLTISYVASSGSTVGRPSGFVKLRRSA